MSYASRRAVARTFLLRTLGLACLFLVGLPLAANATVTLLDFAQEDGNGTKVATASSTGTTIATFNPNTGGGSNIVGINTLAGQVLGTTTNPAIAADETFIGVHSTGAATDGTVISQPFAGTVTFVGRAGSTFNGQSVAGVNILTVTFTDLVLGARGGGTAQITATAPPNTVTFTSGITSVQNFIDNSTLPWDFSITMNGITPSLSVLNPGTSTATINSFVATTEAGTSTVNSVVPEPATTALVLTGLPVLGLAWARRRRTRA